MRKKLIAIIIGLAMLIGLICGCSIEINDDYSEERQTTTTSVTEEETTSSTTTETTTEETTTASTSETDDTTVAQLDEDGVYTTMEDVSLYIFTYGCLPSNFMTKAEARELGW